MTELSTETYILYNNHGAKGPGPKCKGEKGPGPKHPGLKRPSPKGPVAKRLGCVTSRSTKKVGGRNDLVRNLRGKPSSSKISRGETSWSKKL